MAENFKRVLVLPQLPENIVQGEILFLWPKSSYDMAITCIKKSSVLLTSVSWLTTALIPFVHRESERNNARIGRQGMRQR